MIKRTQNFLHDIYNKRDILFELAKRDFQQQYMGSYLGVVWVYLQPLLFIGVLYLVFTMGFKSGGGSEGVPFAVYLIGGMIAWMYLAENLNAGAAIIKKHAFLLKKVDFRLSILPIVKLMSSSIPHLFFIFIAIFIAALNGIYPTLYTLQIIYYFTAMLALLLGIGWLTSSTNIFVPDISKFVGVLVTFGFWLTPIFWDLSRIPERYQWIIKLNPAVYIVEGYRDSIINHIGFWEKPYETLYYWTFTAVMLWSGITVFKRLRPHFAEVA
ncbi:teichoic acid ABC transporter permease [Sulfurovum lithotrophicum]|uniref:Transport permease protein n=1 Tax=Sulfurovum lithotrophicum TaxID=206403 RepID=A0A7U4M034_9BACT|nr:ABC transporter permease [Sulfurovum lithotrophicum]AKF24364.1 teichoic acid ABC transporter permease [Sulfurovum lithotrophicum]